MKLSRKKDSGWSVDAPMYANYQCVPLFNKEDGPSHPQCIVVGPLTWDGDSEIAWNHKEAIYAYAKDLYLACERGDQKEIDRIVRAINKPLEKKAQADEDAREAGVGV